MDDWDASVVVFAGPGEEIHTDRLRASVGEGAAFLPELPVRSVAAVLSALDGMVVSDGGVMHLAVAVGTPTVGIFGSAGKMVMFKQIAGLIARRVVCNLTEGQQVKAGERMGLIRYGSRVDVFLPLSAKLMVEMGQNIFGGKSIIAIFEEGPAEIEAEEELDEYPVLENL